MCLHFEQAKQETVQGTLMERFKSLTECERTF